MDEYGSSRFIVDYIYLDADYVRFLVETRLGVGFDDELSMRSFTVC